MLLLSLSKKKHTLSIVLTWEQISFIKQVHKINSTKVIKSSYSCQKMPWKKNLKRRKARSLPTIKNSQG